MRNLSPKSQEAIAQLIFHYGMSLPQGMNLNDQIALDNKSIHMVLVFKSVKVGILSMIPSITPFFFGLHYVHQSLLASLHEYSHQLQCNHNDIYFVDIHCLLIYTLYDNHMFQINQRVISPNIRSELALGDF